MRLISSLIAKALLVATVSQAGLLASSSEAAACRGGLGTSRTVTLDTSGGARFGSSHGGHRNFLKNKEVVLTFDDGPVPGKTSKVLDVLKSHCARATFFMVGQMASNSPHLVRRALADGHTVGTHSYSHRNLGSTNGKTAIQDVDRTIRAVNKAAGRKVAPFFRFPYLSENRSVNHYLKKRGFGVFAIDVDSLDYRFSSTSSMVNRVMSELNRRGRGIILLHDIQSVTARGLDALLTRLDGAGYKLVHIRGRGGREISDPVLVSALQQELETLSEPRKLKKKRKSAIKRKSTRQKEVAKKKAKPSNKKRVAKKTTRKDSSKVASQNARKKIEARQKALRKKLKDRQLAFRAKIKNRLILQ